jgi:heterodisulfide reductase subunit B2
MKYGFFLGCNMPALRPDVEHAIRLTMPKLGVDLEDLPGYVCCPAFGTFPSMDESAQLAVNAWNLSLGEEKGIDLMVECGSCYSSLKTGKHLLGEAEKKAAADKMLATAGRKYEGKNTVRHITDVLYTDVGVDKIREAVDKSLEGCNAIIQYPCHTLFPSDVTGFEETSAKPHILEDLTKALGAEVEHFSLEYQCCGGAGGFHTSSKAEANAFTKKKFDAILSETNAEVIVVSCVSCLMFLDQVQLELNKNAGKDLYKIPVFDYSQLLALSMGLPAENVATISDTPRDEFIKKYFSLTGNLGL